MSNVCWPKTGLYSFARAQKLASLVPEFRPAFYFSNDLVPRPVGINSQVTIEEIQENAQGEECEETRVINEANSAQWMASCLSNIMTLSPFTVDTVENKGKRS
ncbi:double-stranded RNA-binding protein 2-like [Forsythia ovata]|uniref:Double-stranded RNA-binding protein 2-like n=1 Tax=Forsythia ovata TaxID=205694 RepID=A0ABD1U617_9LAMI